MLLFVCFVEYVFISKINTLIIFSSFHAQICSKSHKDFYLKIQNTMTPKQETWIQKGARRSLLVKLLTVLLFQCVIIYVLHYRHCFFVLLLIKKHFLTCLQIWNVNFPHQPYVVPLSFLINIQSVSAVWKMTSFPENCVRAQNINAAREHMH